MTNTASWKVWIDTGGTFTDCLAISPEGKLHRVKVLSSSALRGKIRKVLSPTEVEIEINWPNEQDLFEGYTFRLLESRKEAKVKATDLARKKLLLDHGIYLETGQEFEITAQEEAPVLAARMVTSTPLSQPLPPIEMRLGSTKGTNALLERKGAKVLFITTKGHADLIRIGTQQRPDIFALDIQKPEPLYRNVIEVNERMDARGNPIGPLTDPEIARIVAEVKAQQPDAVAISFLHSYLNPAHEQALKVALEKAGVSFISCSAELAPAIKILPRAETAVVNAYLSPVIKNYLGSVKSAISEGNLKIMTSAGGLVSAELFEPKDSLLSGPAGGIVGAATIAKRAGVKNILTLDMGGTSTDVAKFQGEYDYQFESTVGDAHLLSPTLAIETVAAGGGSICDFDGLKLTVGPESAGADPGPACYGKGGPLSITDINLLLGRVATENFGIPVSKAASQQAFEKVKAKMKTSGNSLPSDEELLSGFLMVANQKMAAAISKISVSKGYDPKEASLLAFGGAGGQHACSVARQLGMESILLPYDASLLSAYGMGQAVIERFVSKQVLQPLENVKNDLEKQLQELAESAVSLLEKEGFSSDEVEVRKRIIFLRFKGQETALEVEFQEIGSVMASFEKEYRKLYGHWLEKRAVELESIKVVASSFPPLQSQNTSSETEYSPEAIRKTTTFFDGKWQETPVFWWDDLKPGASISGPALLTGKHSTLVIEPGWKLRLNSYQDAILEFNRTGSGRIEQTTEAVELALFTKRFSSIAYEMGALLQRTAFSVNVKERLDFSCALLDPEGELLVNAPHIPVHLGSLGICTRLVHQELNLKPGDVAITNHPAFGGSHLPDITLIAPVHSKEGVLLGYVANRAHHAELGGKTPGSMPPDATSLAEEGVVIKPTLLAENGKVHWEKMEKLLSSGSFPSRSVEENMADLRAALASIASGKNGLAQLADSFGSTRVISFMQKLKAHASQKLENALNQLEKSSFSATEKLDDGSPILVNMSREEGQLTIDFTGTGKTHPQNLNANPSIVNSAIMYVLRLLAGEVPLNEGLMKKVKVILPKGTFLNPEFPDDSANCPAVVGGNTETSQRLVDTLLKAFELSACSYGSMNNLLFGNNTFGFYETIGGGTGAGNGFHGQSGVHQHMTNTRITDPEILEFRYPVRLEKFAIRQGSGGNGKWQGGNGLTREITFLEECSLTVLTQHRTEVPYGMHGGQAGEKGFQQIIRSNGQVETLKGIDGTIMNPGDTISMNTPGGGGFGLIEN